MGVTFEVFQSAGTRLFSRLCCGMGNRSMLKCYGLPFTLTVDTECEASKQSGDLCNSEAWRVDKI